MGIADVLTVKGDYEKAEGYYVEILESVKGRPKDISLTHAYFNYATNFKGQKNLTEANKYFRKAEHLSRKLNYDFFLGLSLQEIGESFFNRNELDSAQLYVEKFIPILEKLVMLVDCVLPIVTFREFNRVTEIRVRVFAQ
jgi:tetratricopeptide (TPR) repeat protein